ncbi:MAG: hypothetical protein KGH60_03765 [Candidatus Micrarchaeota archaeon]|nr:hypothetical protein [Candidatus Micrarchaeota archaeon]
MRVSFIIAIAVAVIAFVVSIFLTQNQTAYHCALQEAFSFGTAVSATCSALSIYEWITALVILFSTLLAVNWITIGRSDLGVWLMGGLGIVLLFFGLIFWFSGDWPAGFLGLTGLFSLFRCRRRTGIFIYHG